MKTKTTKIENDTKIDTSKHHIDIDDEDTAGMDQNVEKLSLKSIDIKIRDIDGIGPTTAKKLREAGIISVSELAVTSADQLAIDIGCSRETAATYIMEAQRLLRKSHILEKEFVSANSLLEKRKTILRCSTGSKTLDELLLGGIETQAVTEFYGEFGSGKSQICFTLSVMAKQPISEGGLDGGVIYIDTEGTFRPERLNQIARARGFDPMSVLKNVAVCKVRNSSHFELIIKDLGRYINEFNAKLVIIDSIISHHRSEYPGRGALAERQQRLNSMLHKLIRLAEILNVVVITNHLLIHSLEIQQKQLVATS